MRCPIVSGNKFNFGRKSRVKFSSIIKCLTPSNRWVNSLKTLIHYLSTAVAEALAIREVVIFIANHEIKDAIIKSDSKEVVDAIHSNKDHIKWEYAAIIDKIVARRTALTNQRLKIKFIGRKANKATHWLTKHEVFMENRGCNIPKELEFILQRDALSLFCLAGLFLSLYWSD